jgi:ribosomal-protein-serine acetyltransferase
MYALVNPILLDFPDHLETERLLIRAPRPGDGVIINEGVRESHAELHRWMPWARMVQTVDESEMVARRMAAKFLLREELMLLLFRKEDGLFAGSSGMHRINWEIPKFEIGYWVRTSMSGQGYITEAVNGITRFAFETLNARRVEIRCDARNERSAAVARRAGYALDGTLRLAHTDNDGNPSNTHIFSKIREDYFVEVSRPL